ncbi:hypothetical protein CDAR_458451 [Caerostris darwini]|uniref:Uncharacterized protein n=1 Tax=Caerostris darwini TaxID=1538125 RepID=A0AAV4NQY5_9ARAC|nr:hypothetical protein CDAR_458451 [Caerostris darwini]
MSVTSDMVNWQQNVHKYEGRTSIHPYFPILFPSISIFSHHNSESPSLSQSWLNCRAAPKPFKNNHELGIANLAFDPTNEDLDEEQIFQAVEPAQVSVKTEGVPEYAAVTPTLMPPYIGVNLVETLIKEWLLLDLTPSVAMLLIDQLKP